MVWCTRCEQLTVPWCGTTLRRSETDIHESVISLVFPRPVLCLFLQTFGEKHAQQSLQDSGQGREQAVCHASAQMLRCAQDDIRRAQRCFAALSMTARHVLHLSQCISHEICVICIICITCITCICCITMSARA